MGRATDANIKDTSLVISAEMSGFQQSISNSVTTDSRFTNIEKTLNEISNMLKNHQINATYDPNNPKMKQDFSRFRTYCKKSGHTVKFLVTQEKKTNEEKAPPEPKEKYSQNYANRSKSPNKYRSNSNDRSNAQRGRTTAHTLQTAIVAEVTVILELFALKQELTRLTRCMTHCSHAIL